jgi:AAA domain
MTAAVELVQRRKTLALKHVGHLPETIKREYIIKGIFEPNTLAVIYGEPGCGKSFLAEHFAYRVSLGKRVFGRRVHQVPALYIGLEGEAGVERRVCAAVNRWLPSGHFFFVTEALDLLGGIADAEAIMDAAEAIRVEHVGEPPKLIVIDTFARAMGNGSENEPADMGAMIQVLDAIRRYSGACIALVHHCGKDKSRGMRGHSSLLAACDTVIEVERTEAGRSFRITKSKDGVDGETFSFELDVVTLGTDEDGDPITSCVVKEGEQQTTKAILPGLTLRERGWLKDLHAIFAEPGAGEAVASTLGLTLRHCLSRDEVREGLKKRGRFTLNTDANLTPADRTRLSEILNSLKFKGKIGLTDKHVWLMSQRGTDA